MFVVRRVYMYTYTYFTADRPNGGWGRLMGWENTLKMLRKYGSFVSNDLTFMFIIIIFLLKLDHHKILKKNFYYFHKIYHSFYFILLPSYHFYLYISCSLVFPHLVADTLILIPYIGVSCSCSICTRCISAYIGRVFHSSCVCCRRGYAVSPHLPI